MESLAGQCRNSTHAVRAHQGKGGLGLNSALKEWLHIERGRREVDREEKQRQHLSHATKVKTSQRTVHTYPGQDVECPSPLVMCLPTSPKPNLTMRNQQADQKEGLSTEKYVTSPPRNVHERQGKNTKRSSLREE